MLKAIAQALMFISRGEAIADTSVRVPLSSSAIREIEYDFTTETLTVDFTDGDSHSYGGVSPGTFLSFATAGSPGSYFNANIRNSY
jgi:hypothetical protein